jgi:23S rRNA pseudouridine1911/1915/1917 synthase
MHEVIVDEEYAGQRLDSYVASIDKNYSRSIWKKLIDQGYVLLDGEKTNGKKQIKTGQTITINDLEPLDELSLDIIYENADVLAINKPAGVLTHLKSDLASEPTIASFISKKTTASGGNRAGIVHRLDRATSGVILTAKNDKARVFMTKQFSNRRVQKWYLAVVKGDLDQSEYHIDKPIGRSYSKPSHFRVTPNGKNAVTDVFRLIHGQSTSVVLLKPTTGRTHQLRVHLASLGHPIVGDPIYSKPYNEQKHPVMQLHAWQLEATLPDNDRRDFVADVPESMTKYFTDECRDKAKTIIASQKYSAPADDVQAD